jgi:hypothetical protein
MQNPKAEAARIRYLYRSLILRGELKLPRDAAIPLVGPDCAYHLYRGYLPRRQLGVGGISESQGEGAELLTGKPPQTEGNSFGQELQVRQDLKTNSPTRPSRVLTP